jgi:hypothetical protein
MNDKNAEEWKRAMDLEFNSLINNETWELVDLPPEKKTIGTKWVFKVKQNPDGTIERFKARLVAKGYSQVEGIDYQETFAPVVRLNTIRIILAIANHFDMEIQHMDVDTAFLYGNLQEEIYIQQPEGFISQPEKVCRLKKSIYGLKQAPKVWNDLLDHHLQMHDFKRSETDPCVYFKRKEENITIIAIYVDDMIIATTSMKEMLEIKAIMKTKFKMKDLGEITYCLGLQIQRNRKEKTLSLHQTKYINEMIKIFGMEEAKPVSTPTALGIALEKKKKEDEEESKYPYKEAVGKLLYAMTGSRPDIAFATSLVSRFMSNYDSTHWTAVKRILRYLKGTNDLCITFKKTSEALTLIGACDSDWGGDKCDRKSTFGYIFLLDGAPISWVSKKQSIVALSTTEAEYIATTHAAKEAIWIRKLMSELGHEQKQPTTIFEDNKSCIALANNPVFHMRTKHIDIQYHFIREAIKQQHVSLEYCPTEQMTADAFTKPLPTTKFIDTRVRMGLQGCTIEGRC